MYNTFQEYSTSKPNYTYLINVIICFVFIVLSSINIFGIFVAYNVEIEKELMCGEYHILSLTTWIFIVTIIDISIIVILVIYYIYSTYFMINNDCLWCLYLVELVCGSSMCIFFSLLALIIFYNLYNIIIIIIGIIELNNLFNLCNNHLTLIISIIIIIIKIIITCCIIYFIKKLF